MNNQGETLNYISSAPDFDFAPVDTTKPQDEADISTLEQVFKLIKDRQAHYQSIASLDLRDDKFTIETQLAINQQVVFHLQELETLLTTTITKVRSKLNG